jgi:hypothetical protein
MKKIGKTLSMWFATGGTFVFFLTMTQKPTNSVEFIGFMLFVLGFGLLCGIEGYNKGITTVSDAHVKKLIQEVYDEIKESKANKKALEEAIANGSHEEKKNALLDQISKFGILSLTTEQKNLLKELSK